MMRFYTYVMGLLSSLFMLTSTRHCYYGNDVSSLPALRNQSCQTGKIHLTNSLMVTDHTDPTSISWHVSSQQSFINSSSHLTTSEASDGKCLIYRYVSIEVLSPVVTKESVHVNFSCDTEGVCNGKHLNRLLSNVTLRGHRGHLYCCSGENCNNITKMPHLSTENRLCYQGTNNGTLDGELSACGRPGIACARTREFLKHRTVENFFCDHSKLCESDQLFGAFRSCQNTTTKDNITKELCCCYQNYCFMPPPSVGEKQRNDSHDYRPPRLVIPPSIQNPSNVVVTAVVVVAITVVSLCGSLALVLTCRRRQAQSPGHPDVIMQYERLSASDTEEAAVV